MNTVILYGDKKDNPIINSLKKILKENNCINIFEQNSINSEGEGEIINIILTNNIRILDIKDAVIILLSNAKINNIKFIEKSCKIIINANNTKQISKMSKYSNKIYTCGFSSKDYVTFSSRNKDSAVVSLQRSIKVSKNKSCEPFETPCIINSDIDDFSILSCILTIVFLVNQNENIKCDLTRIYFS